MKTYEITVSGKTESDILNGIDEARKRIEAGNYAGFDSNDSGEFSFDSDGVFEESESEN